MCNNFYSWVFSVNATKWIKNEDGTNNHFILRVHECCCESTIMYGCSLRGRINFVRLMSQSKRIYIDKKFIYSLSLGCTNQFVAIRYNSADSTISCAFLNPTDTSIKLCRVIYGPCGEEQTRSVEGFSSIELPNNITLIVPRGSYCYTATANTDNFTVAVQGMIQSKSHESTLILPYN